jgi:hypothetical protein
MSVERLAFLADHLAQPATDLRAVDIVVVDPALVTGVVRRVDVNALHLAGVSGEQRLQRVQVVALDNQIAAVGHAAGQIGHRFEESERDVLVVFDHGVFADPAQGGHSRSIFVDVG